MASRKKMKLPPLKVKQRSTSGKTVQRVIPRGILGPVGDRVDTNLGTVEGPRSAVGDRVDTNLGTVEGPRSGIHWDSDEHSIPADSLPEPSLHKITQESAIAGWNKVRPDLLRVVIETSAVPSAQLCCLCTNEATYRCLSCSPTDFFCGNCFNKIHEKKFFFHTGEVWEVRSMWYLFLL